MIKCSKKFCIGTDEFVICLLEISFYNQAEDQENFMKELAKLHTENAGEKQKIKETDQVKLKMLEIQTKGWLSGINVFQ